jgi:hypothetical protein
MNANRLAAQARSERIAIFAMRIAALFEQLPMLCAFRVNEGLEVEEITFQHDARWSKREASDAIQEAVDELLDDDVKDAFELLRGRTFARAIH